MLAPLEDYRWQRFPDVKDHEQQQPGQPRPATTISPVFRISSPLAHPSFQLDSYRDPCMGGVRVSPKIVW